MNDYLKELNTAMNQQEHNHAYDLYIASPLLEQLDVPIPNKDESKCVNFTFRIPIWLKKELENITDLEGGTISQYCINALINALVKHRDTEEARKIYKDHVLAERKAIPPRSDAQLIKFIQSQMPKPTKEDEPQ